MRIGELARRAGIGVQAIRYYERLNLLKAPARMASGYRNYEFTDLERVVFIRRTQTFGFSLEEIRKLAEAHSALMQCPRPEQAADPQLRFIIDMFEQKRRAIAERIHELQQLEQGLHQGINKLTHPSPQCPAGETGDPRCPISKPPPQGRFAR